MSFVSPNYERILSSVVSKVEMSVGSVTQNAAARSARVYRENVLI